MLLEKIWPSWEPPCFHACFFGGLALCTKSNFLYLFYSKGTPPPKESYWRPGLTRCHRHEEGPCPSAPSIKPSPSAQPGLGLAARTSTAPASGAAKVGAPPAGESPLNIGRNPKMGLLQGDSITKALGVMLIHSATWIKVDVSSFS